MLHDRTLTIDETTINMTDVVRDLGVLLDSELSMTQHVAKVAFVCFYHRATSESSELRSSLMLNLRQRDHDMLSQLWSNYSGCQSRRVYSLSSARWCAVFITVSAGVLVWCGSVGRDHVDTRSTAIDRLQPRTIMQLRDCGPSLASVRAWNRLPEAVRQA